MDGLNARDILDSDSNCAPLPLVRDAAVQSYIPVLNRDLDQFCPKALGPFELASTSRWISSSLRIP